MFFYVRCIVILAVFFIFPPSLGVCGDMEMPKSPRPDWSVELPIDLAAKPPEQLPGGMWYLVVDFQWNVANSTKFSRLVRKYVTANAVREGSRITVEYNPAFESLVWHTLEIYRNGLTIDALPKQKFRLLSRESGLEDNLYDGRQTVVLELEGVETGDVVEYSFSRIGSNPVFAGKFSEITPTSWPFAIHQLRTRFLYPAERKIAFKEQMPILAEIPDSASGPIADRRWEASDVEAVVDDPDTPAWDSPHSLLQASEYSSWEAVVNWAKPRFAVSDSLPEKLAPVMKDLRMEVTDQAQIEGALKYVQDNIRYLSVSEGVHSHEPYPIDDVIRKGFGDCKDKARLLCAMLKELGFDANVALVSTKYRGRVVDFLPTPLVFDHVVVRVRRDNGDVYWLDPTISHQRGELGKRYFPDFQKALVVGKDSTELTDVQPSGFAESGLNVTDEYKISDFGGEVTMTRETVYRGALADQMRAYQVGENPERLGKSLLDLFSRNFPGAIALEEPRFTDDEDLNEIVVNEAYSLKNFWQNSPRDGEQLTAEINAQSLGSDLAMPIASRHDAVLRRNHPRNISHLITIKFPDRTRLSPKSRVVEDDSFAYNFDVSQRGPVVSILHEYRSKRDFVPPEARDTFLAHLKEANNLLSFTLDAEKSGSSADQPFGKYTNWLFVMVAVGTVLICAGICVALYFWRPQWRGRELRMEYDEIGGWLFVVAIALVVRPFIQIFPLIELGRYADLRNWMALTTPGLATYHPLWGVTIIIELIYRTWYVVFDLFLIVLFVQRRRTFPVLMIVVLVSTIAFVAGTELLYHSLLGDLPPSTTVSRPIVSAILWTYYLLVSKRVKGTFVN